MTSSGRINVIVYENPNAIAIAPTQVPTVPPINSFAWGIFPMVAFISAVSLGALRIYPIQAKWIIRKVYAFTIGVLPIALCFWLYHTIGDFPHPRVYFTYDNALFFLSDGLALLAIVLWLTVKIARSAFLFPFPIRNTTSQLAPSKFIIHNAKRSFIIFLSAFCILTTLSLLWSRDWRTSLYISLHFSSIQDEDDPLIHYANLCKRCRQNIEANEGI